jgi:hypothetical protein
MARYRKSRLSRTSRRTLRRRRITRRARREKQKGGDGNIPNDDATVIVRRNGNDIDSVETPVSEPVFEQMSTAAPDKSL